MLPWGFLKTEVPIMEPSGINKVWHCASENPELDVASPLLHYILIKPLKHRCGFCMLMVWKFSVKYTHRGFFAVRRTWGLCSVCVHLPRCVYQHKYHAAAASAADNCCRDPATLGGMNSPASVGCGKRTLQCDAAYHYTNLIPNNPSEFNSDIAEIQFAREKRREGVIICVTHICYILNKTWTEKICFNFLFYSVRIHAQAHTELLWKATYQLLVPISSDGEAGPVDHY